MGRARRRVAVAAAGAVAALPGAVPPAAEALPSCEAAPCPSDADRPVLVLSYYRDRDFRKLVLATRRSGLPNHTPVYHGGYWGKAVRQVTPDPGPPPPPQPGPPKPPTPPMPGRRFAPIVTLVRTQFWKRRGYLTADQRAVLEQAGQGEPDGRIPSMRRIMAASAGVRYAWGVELGRRYRDRIRKKRAKGKRIVTWQLDELVSELPGPDGGKLRQFTQGVLQGLTYGRGELGDVRLPGIVWATGPALRMARRPARGPLASFWRQLDDSTIYLVGEEYPAFTGSPGAAARRYGSWRSLLHSRGGARRSLARKYVVGMTPGHRVVPGLGGNVRDRPRSSLLNWRMRFIRARARSGPAGLAQYNFTFENATWPAIRDVLEAVASGLRVVRRVSGGRRA